MPAGPSRFGLSPLFVRSLAALAVSWVALALLGWIWPTSAIRTLLVLLAGTALVGGAAWYAVAGWAWRLGRGNAGRIRQPAVLVMVAWLACVGTALVSGRPGQATPTPNAVSASKVFDTGLFKYLSDLPVFDARPGSWPIVKNGLIGEGGKVIVVNGDSSPKGIGMHPPDNADAVVKFRLHGEAARFKAKAAINDTAGRIASSAVFEVLGDGKPLWKSDPLDKAGRCRECNVDVTGVDVLELRVRATGPRQELHAVWMEPRILHSADTPDTPPPFVHFSRGPVEYLSDMPEFDVKAGPWPFAKNGDFGGPGPKIKVDDIPSPHGLGMHATTTGFVGVKYHLDKQAAVFKARTALNDGCSFTIGSCHFEVLGDGKSLWKSKTVSKEKQIDECRLDVTGVDVLELRVVNPDIVNHGLNAVWFEPRVLQTADTPDE